MLTPATLLDEAGIKVLELLFVKATDEELVLARGAEVLTSDELVWTNGLELDFTTAEAVFTGLLLKPPLAKDAGDELLFMTGLELAVLTGEELALTK